SRCTGSAPVATGSSLRRSPNPLHLSASFRPLPRSLKTGSRREGRPKKGNSRLSGRKPAQGPSKQQPPDGQVRRVGGRAEGASGDQDLAVSREKEIAGRRAGVIGSRIEPRGTGPAAAKKRGVQVAGVQVSPERGAGIGDAGSRGPRRAGDEEA